MSLASKLKTRLRWGARSSILRLTLLLSLVFALGMAAAVFVALSLGRAALIDRIDETLEGVAASVEADDAPEDSASMILRPVAEVQDLPPVFARVARDGGGTVDLDRDFRGADVWRLLLAEDSEGIPILIAVPLDDGEEALDVLGGVLWSTALVVLAAALAIGIGAGLLAQRRMARITGTLDRMAGGDLQARTGITGGSDDLADLARQMDVTAAELDRLVTQTRHLSASIAHDLRTPLARLRARLEMLPEGEARGAALEEAARLSGIFDTIMRVARIEAGQGTEGFAPVDLGALVADLAETFGPVIEDAGKRLVVEVKAPATVQGDHQMLVQAMANLVQNALVHGGDQVTLFAHGQALGVSDNGAGVDPDQYAEVLKPMVRGDAARSTEGSGLGLALVRAVALRHGAELSLDAADPSGLRVVLKFTQV